MLGEELRSVREKAGMTQEDLAFEADLSRQYISDLENGKKCPTVNTLIRLCRTLGVSASAIIRRVEDSWPD